MKIIVVADIEANQQNLKSEIADTKLYVPTVTLSDQNNIKLLTQLESGFKRTINWNKYLSKTTNQVWNIFRFFNW